MMESKTKITQRMRILEHFRAGGTLTSVEALRLYGIERLASRICDLKKMGFSIKKTTETGVNQFGEPTRYARYGLEV